MFGKKVVHCKKEKYDVYIGRPSIWGNPFSHKTDSIAEFKVASREEAVKKFEEWILTKPELLSKLFQLKGKNLGCWCSPKICHGDVLSRLAECVDDTSKSFDRSKYKKLFSDN